MSDKKIPDFYDSQVSPHMIKSYLEELSLGKGLQDPLSKQYH